MCSPNVCVCVCDGMQLCAIIVFGDDWPIEFTIALTDTVAKASGLEHYSWIKKNELRFPFWMSLWLATAPSAPLAQARRFDHRPSMGWVDRKTLIHTQFSRSNASLLLRHRHHRRQPPNNKLALLLRYPHTTAGTMPRQCFLFRSYKAFRCNARTLAEQPQHFWWMIVQLSRMRRVATDVCSMYSHMFFYHTSHSLSSAALLNWTTGQKIERCTHSGERTTRFFF